MRLSRIGWLYLGAVALAALALLVYWWMARGPASPVSPALVALLLALAVAAQQFPLMLAPGYQINVATAIYFTAVLIANPVAAMALTGLSQLAGGAILAFRHNPQNGRRRRGPAGIVFNAGQLMLAIGAAGLVYAALRPAGGAAGLDQPASLWAVPAAAAALHLVSGGLVAAMVGLQRGCSPAAVWRAGWRDEALEAVGLSLFGLIMALLVAHYPWAPLLLVLPAVVLHWSAQRTAQFLAARRAAEGQLRHQATHDALTGLPNRAAFLARLEQALAGAVPGGVPAVLFLDLDGFKVVNDSLGHVHGDKLLVAVAERLVSTLGEGGATVARLGGDEFIVLLERVAGPLDAEAAAWRLLDGFAAPFPLGGRDLVIGASVGITVAPDGAARALDLLRQADIAMYQAKAAGRGGYAVFDAAMSRQAEERLALEADLRHAESRDELVVHYQPTFALATGEIAGVEALVRWQHPRRGLVSPAEFIPLAEETGLILPIGRWILAEACRQLVDWHARYPTRGRPDVAVNLSARQLRDPGLAEDVASALRRSGLAPRHLTLELTESMLMDDVPATLATLARLKALGVRLAIDDFGTGYSSLAYLKQFPLDILKIDRAFVGGLGCDERDTAIVRTVLLLGQALGLQTTAEGIETADQAAHLRALGCALGQGYHLTRPLPAAELEARWALAATRPVRSLAGPAYEGTGGQS